MTAINFNSDELSLITGLMIFIKTKKLIPYDNEIIADSILKKIFQHDKEITSEILNSYVKGENTKPC